MKSFYLNTLQQCLVLEKIIIKKFLVEAHNLSDHLIGCFLKDKDLKNTRY